MIETLKPNELEKIRTRGVKDGNKEFSTPLSLSQLSQATLTAPPKKVINKKPGRKRVFIPTPVKEIAKSLPGRVGFDLQFEPPEGVPENELNSVEKIFFSFYKRCYETFVSAVYRTISEQIASKPSLKKYLTGPSLILSATVTFNEKGEITDISKVKGTVHSELRALYRVMLQNMNGIPNPPALFIKKNNRFKMYYKLKVGLK